MGKCLALSLLHWKSSTKGTVMSITAEHISSLESNLSPGWVALHKSCDITCPSDVWKLVPVLRTVSYSPWLVGAGCIRSKSIHTPGPAWPTDSTTPKLSLKNWVSRTRSPWLWGCGNFIPLWLQRRSASALVTGCSDGLLKHWSGSGPARVGKGQMLKNPSTAATTQSASIKYRVIALQVKDARPALRQKQIEWFWFRMLSSSELEFFCLLIYCLILILWFIFLNERKFLR